MNIFRRGHRQLDTYGPTAVVASRAEPIVGLNVQPSVALDMLPHLQALGVRHVRASWWVWSQPEDWSWLPEYRAAGIDVLPVVSVADGALHEQRVERLFDAVGPLPAVQLGNEPDGGVVDDAVGYGTQWGQRVRWSAHWLRARYPGIRIVSPGLAWNTRGVEDWLRAFLAAKPGIDVLAIHCYGIGSAGEPLSRYQRVRACGWTGPVWATELGTDLAQAAYIDRDPDDFQREQLAACFSTDPSRYGYERLYWFQLPDDGWGQGWGLLDARGVPRPAFHELRRLAGSRRP